MTTTGPPVETGISAVSPVLVPDGHVHVTLARGSSRTVTVVGETDSRTIRWESWRVGVTVTRPSPAPLGAAAARREAVKVRDVSWAAPSRAVTVIEMDPDAGVVTSTRSSLVITPSTSIVTVIGASPPAVSTNIVECSGSMTVPTPGSAMYSPLAVWKRTVIAGVPPRLTTSASKIPVTPSWTPIPIHRSRTPALTARPSTPFGATKRRTSGR